LSGAIPEGVKITPWLAQYKKWKEEYPDALLLFRMGDFYECFFDDARELSSVLNITLTSRDAEKNIPMSGIPQHALPSYLRRLIRAGCRVAICDQIGEPDGKNIVERRVVRVVTPGTYVPEEAFDKGGNTGNLAAVVPVGKDSLAVALLSTDTGRLEAGTLPIDEAAAILSAFTPGEVLYPANVNVEKFPQSIRALPFLPQANEIFKPSVAASRLKTAMGSARLEGYGLTEDNPCVGPAWAVLDYLSSTQFSAVRHVLRVFPLTPGGRMYLDESALKNLDLMPDNSDSTRESHSLFSCLNRCRTPMGRRTLRDWLLRPLIDPAAIAKRQDAIGILVPDPVALDELHDALSACRDVERALSRLCIGTGNPKDVGSIRDTL